MARASYQYGTSPRKYEPEYTTRKTTVKKAETKKVSKQVPKKEIERKKLEKEKAKKAEERKSKTKQVIVVIAVFAMLLALSYREISIMEMFNEKKELENKLSLIQKENGQVEKNLKEEESKLEWNSIRQKAQEELGMQAKMAIPVDLEKTDNVETRSKLIKEDKQSLLEKIVGYIINR